MNYVIYSPDGTIVMAGSCPAHDIPKDTDTLRVLETEHLMYDYADYRVVGGKLEQKPAA